MNAIDLLQRLWPATLALSAALAIVAALRVPWRRAFGVEHACHLWWIPLVALIGSQLPHAAAQTSIVHVPSMLISTASATPIPVRSATRMDWRVSIAILWFMGACALLLVAIMRQCRFLRALRAAQPMVCRTPAGIYEILRAPDAATGPALIGVWRARLVLPCDFEQRYDARERVLILAHEAMHARRRDALIGACATALHALFWFNPLAWWALPRLRRDQELACDAAVLRGHPRSRRRYANAMLKAQFAGAVLPVGSFWPVHPITERINMLTLAMPDATRRLIGRTVVSGLALAVGVAIYVTSPPRALAAAKPDVHATEYQLAMRIMRDGQVIASPVVCMKSGVSASISQSDSRDGRSLSFQLNLRVQESRRDEIRVSLDGSLRQGSETGNLNLSLSGPPGKPMSVRVNEAPQTELEILPTRGCTARSAPPPLGVHPPPLPPRPPPPPRPASSGQ